MTLDPAFHALAVCLTALVFVHAGVSKLLAREEFQGVVANYHLLPAALIAPFAVLLPIAELGAGLGVLAVATRSSAALLAAGLLLLLAAAMGINLARGRREIDCGCFKSAFKQTISGWLIARNLLLAGVALALLLPPSGRAPGVLDYVTAVAGGVMLFLGYYAAGVLTRRPVARDDAALARAASKTRWKAP
ncbi:MAG TPA: MauE/DoxX family redox-associated membrane protein [Burkholderiales bacterium]|jgi:hypothetical protein|nr:MauE/DoxX family redox-associated membrane protein [Burkholderiales bacterium]